MKVVELKGHIMSHHSEEMLNASSDSFWEPGNFKR